MVTMRAGLAAGVAAGAFALGGCVGYDGGSDDASLAAQSLGLTAKEEETIRGALAQKALTADEIAKLERELDAESGLPREWTTQSAVTAAATKFKSQGDYEACTSDINCRSLHCAQSNICLPAWKFKEPGEPATYAFECRSSEIKTVERCAARWFWGSCKRTESVQVCREVLTTDNDNVKNAGETDVDCGGTSLFRCPVGRSCATSADCAIGICEAGACQARGAGLIDLGRFWTEASPSDRPYSSVVRVPVERDAAAQIREVQRAVRPDSLGRLQPAERQFAYQHDTCVQHLLANECSPIAIETRIHREAFQNIICRRARSAAIGILAHAEVTDHVFDVGREAELGRKALSVDPYLCNHSFTRAASVISHTQVQPWGYVRDTRPSPFSGFWGGAGLMSNEGIWDGTRCADGTRCGNAKKKAEALKWALQVEELLLAGAACSKGRVVVGRGAPSAGPVAPPGFDPHAFCRRFQGEAPVRAGGSSANPAAIGTVSAVTAAEWEFIRMNVPWWNDYDIYSIDPEGNPYAPVNMNMQYGWDAMHPGMNFGAYASSFGATLVPTSTTYTFNGSAATVWGTSRTTTFGWNVAR